jgi:YHS domain-containing protein
MRQLIVLALILALGYLVTRLLSPRRLMSRSRDQQASTAVTEEMVQDPNCHTYLPRSQGIRRKIRGREYFFCSPGCLDKFLAGRS